MIKPIKIIISGVDKYSAVIGGALKNVNDMGKKVNGIGKTMSVGFTLPFFAAAGASIKFSTDLNAAMANVATLVPDNIKRIVELKGAVQALAVETGKSATDIAAGLYQTISTFQDSADTVKILGINTRAAVAGLATVSDAINLTSSVTQVWGDTSAKAIATAADFAFQTAYLGKTTFPELAASLSNVTLPSKLLGISMSEMFAAMAHSTNITNSTSASSTQFASALREMLNPSAELIQLMDHLGYKSGPAMIKGMGGIVPALQKIQELATQVDMPLQKFLGRSEAMMFAMQFTGKSADKFSGILKNMSDTAVAGATDRAFKQQTDGINKTGFALSQTIQKLSIASQKFGDAIAPALNAVIDFGTPLLDWLAGINPVAKQAIFGIGLVIAITGPLIVAISAIAAVVVTATLPVVGFVAAWVGGAILIGAAIALIAYKWGAIKTFFAATWTFIVNIFKSRGAQRFLHEFPLTTLPMLIIDNWSKISSFFENVFDKVKTTIDSFGKWLKDTPVYSFFQTIGKSLGSMFSGSTGSGLQSTLKYWAGSEDGTGFYGTPTGTPASGPLRNSLTESRRTEITKSEQKLKVEFANMPNGTTVKPSGNWSMLNNIDVSLGYPGVVF